MTIWLSNADLANYLPLDKAAINDKGFMSRLHLRWDNFSTFHVGSIFLKHIHPRETLHPRERGEDTRNRID